MRYQSKRPKRQFLAGVKCPSCQKLDAVVQVQVFEPEPDEYIECTQCAYTERRPDPVLPSESLFTNAAVEKDSVGVIRFIK